MTPDIDIRQLRVSYGETTAIDDLSVALPGGRIYGLLGREGSGKTSLLATIAAFRKPSAGTIHVAGLPVFENLEATQRMCLVRESTEVGDPGDSIHDTLAIVARLRRSWDRMYADTLVERFQLPRRKKIGQLSPAERSALTSMIGLASRAPLTMFDECHLGMDAQTRQIFCDEVRSDVLASPRTIILAAHLVDETSSLFERILILDRGGLLLNDDPDAIRSRGAVLTGPSSAVADLVAGLTVLERRELGKTSSVSVYGAIDDAMAARARQADVEVGPIPLQDLFVHLTAPTGETR